MKHIQWFSSMILIVGLTSCLAQEGGTPIPLDPELRYGKLDNGFTYYIRNIEETSQLEKPGRIYVQLVSPGERFEDEDQLGLAHVIEHMLARGDSLFDHAGAGFYASFYYKEIPSDKSELLFKTLRGFRKHAQSKQMLNRLWDAEQVNLVGRDPVLREFYAKKGSTMFDLKKSYEILNNPEGHRYLDLDISYYRHNEYIKTFKLEPLVRFFKDWYRPDTQALILVGDLDVEKVERQVITLFSNMKMPDVVREKSMEESRNEVRITLPERSKVITLSDTVRSDIGLEICYTRQGVMKGEIATEEQYREQLIQQLYNTMMRSRMSCINQQYNVPIIERVVHYAGSGILNGGDVTQIDANLTKVVVKDFFSIRKAFQLVMTELERVRQHGFIEAELTMAKKVVLKDFVEKIKNKTRMANQYMNHFLFDGAAPGPEYEEKMVARMIADISVKEVHAFAQKWLEMPDRNVIFTVPKGLSMEVLPKEAEVSRWVTDIKNSNIPPYGEFSLEEGPKQLMSEGEIQQLSDNVPYQEIKKSKDGTTWLQLANGIRVILKPVENNEGKFFFKGVNPIGATTYGQDYNTALKASDIIYHSGAGGWDTFELEKYCKKNSIRVRPSITEDISSIEGEAPLNHLGSMLQLVYLYMKEPNKSEEAFKDWLTEEKRAVQQKKKNKNILFHKLVETEIFGTKEEISLKELEHIQLGKAYEIYKEIFSNTSFTFAIAGNFDPDTIEPVLIKYLGNLPAIEGKPKTNIITKQQPRISPKTGIAKTFLGKQNDFYGISINYKGSYTNDVETNLKLEVLHKILYKTGERHSSKSGLYYPIRFRFRYTDNYYLFHVAPWIQEAKDIKTVKKVVSEEVGRLHNQVPDAADFHAAIVEIRDQLEKDMKTYKKSNNFWVNNLLGIWNEKSIEEIEQQLSLLEEINPMDIRELSRTYLAKDSLSTIEMIPERENGITQ